MTDLPDWADARCPSCDGPMVNSRYDRCYSCTPNSRIARDAAAKAGPTAWERERRNRIEAAAARGDELRIVPDDRDADHD